MSWSLRRVQRKGSLYAVSLQPLITRLSTSSSAKQCWYAVDATGSGFLDDVKKWWDEPSTGGSALGYFPNAKKCWLIAKPEKEDAAREIFRYTAINITSEGNKYLGATIGSRGPFLKSPENSSGPKSQGIWETANRLFWKADLLTCFQGNKKQTNCDVWRLKSSPLLRYKGNSDTKKSFKESGLSRNASQIISWRVC